MHMPCQRLRRFQLLLALVIARGFANKFFPRAERLKYVTVCTMICDGAGTMYKVFSWSGNELVLHADVRVHTRKRNSLSLAHIYIPIWVNCAST